MKYLLIILLAFFPRIGGQSWDHFSAYPDDLTIHMQWRFVDNAVDKELKYQVYIDTAVYTLYDMGGEMLLFMDRFMPDDKKLFDAYVKSSMDYDSVKYSKEKLKRRREIH